MLSIRQVACGEKTDEITAISETLRDGKIVDDVRSFIGSLKVEPEAMAFAHAVLSHWGVGRC